MSFRAEPESSNTSISSNSDDNRRTDVISAETSARVCRHMNEDHAVSVYAMAARCLAKQQLQRQQEQQQGQGQPTTGWKLTSARMLQITAQGCHLQAISCTSGDLCEIKTVVYPFTPPLTHAAQVKSRLVAIHHQVLSPQWQWIYSKPFAMKFSISFAALAYGTLVLGGTGMKALLDQTNLIKSFYPRTDILVLVVQAVFYIIMVAHICEAVFAAYICRSTLKLKWQGTLQWMIFVGAVGFPILNELQTLQQVHLQELKEKKEEETTTAEGIKKES